MNLGMSVLQFPFSASSSFAGRWFYIFPIIDAKMNVYSFSWLYGDYGCQLYGAAGFFFGIGVVISLGLIILEGFLIISGKRITAIVPQKPFIYLHLLWTKDQEPFTLKLLDKTWLQLHICIELAVERTFLKFREHFCISIIYRFGSFSKNK